MKNKLSIPTVFKRIMFFSIAFSLIYNCEKEDIIDDTLQPQSKISNLKKSKIDVCHYNESTDSWEILSINTNAIEAHINHGDVRLDDQDNDGFFPNNKCDFGPMGDCDDLNSAISPSTEEVCDNGIDDNCDGDFDENDESCTSKLTVYINPDGIEGNGDEYNLLVHPIDNIRGTIWGSSDIDIPEVENSLLPRDVLNDFNGQLNTRFIVATLQDFDAGNGLSYAAKICNDLVAFNYDDWYLPSIGELSKIFEKYSAREGRFSIRYYWTSNEQTASSAFALLPDSDFILSGGKSARILGCRCVRKEE